MAMYIVCPCGVLIVGVFALQPRLASVGKFQRLSVAHVATSLLLIVNTQLIGFTNISSMECPQEAPAAHRGGDGGVRGGD